MTNPNERDFLQFRDAFNAPITPSVAFAKQIQAMAKGTSHPKTGTKSSWTTARRTIRWQDYGMTAAAILVVIALTATALRPWQSGNEELRGITYFPASTPEETTPPDSSTQYSGYGGADKSYQIGPVSDNLSDELQLLEPVSSDEEFRGNSLVVNDVLIVSVPFEGTVAAYSATTHELLWRLDDLKLIGIVSDGQRLYAFQSGGRYGVVALSLETGEEVWFHQDPNATSEEFQGDGPLVSGNHVYMNNGLNSFYALEADSGMLVWEITVDSVDTQRIGSQNDPRSPVSSVPELAVVGTALIAIINSQFLVAMDTSSGDVLWTQRVADPPGTGTLTTQLSTVGDTALVSSVNDSFFNCEETGWCQEYYGASVGAYDVATGELRWRQDFSDLIARSVATGSDVYAFTLNGISILDLESGEVVAELDYEPNLTFKEMLTLPASVRVSGETIFAVFATPTGYSVTAYEDRSQTDHWSSNFESGRTSSITAVFAMNGGLIFQSLSGWIFVLPAEDQATPTAVQPETPAASGFGGADRSFNMGELPDFGQGAEMLVEGEPDTSARLAQVVGDYLIRILEVGTPDNRSLEVIDLATGSRLWSETGYFEGGLSSDGSSLFVTTTDSAGSVSVVAMDLESGARIWTSDSHPGEQSFDAPGTIYSSGIVFASINESTVVALDAGTGKPFWSKEFPVVAIESDVIPGQLPVIAISGNTLIVAWNGRFVSALDPQSGDIVWSHDFYEGEDRHGSSLSVVADSNAVYVAAEERIPSNTQDGSWSLQPHRVRAYALADGQWLWDSGVYQATEVVAVADSELIAVTAFATIYSIDTESGELVSQRAMVGGYPSSISMFHGYVVHEYLNAVRIQDTKNLYNQIVQWEVGDPLTDGGGPDSHIAMVWNGHLVFVHWDGSVWILGGESDQATPVA